MEFLEDPTLGVSEVSRCACFREEFLEQGFGVWSLGLCFHCQVLGAISMVSADVCLEKKGGDIRPRGRCLVSGRQGMGPREKCLVQGVGKRNMSKVSPGL